MKAKDVRIGNYAKNENGNIVEMCATRILKFSEGEIKYEPITLTEEWFAKFGFEQIIHLDDYRCILSTYSKNGVYIDFPYVEFNIHENSKEIKYVHSLQNIYFALTNEELNIKLPID